METSKRLESAYRPVILLVILSVTILSTSRPVQGDLNTMGLTIPPQMPMPPTSTKDFVLKPHCIDKYVDDLVLPAIMPRVPHTEVQDDDDTKDEDNPVSTCGQRTAQDELEGHNGTTATRTNNCKHKRVDRYEISVRQIKQRVLPETSSKCARYPHDPQTKVFAYGSDVRGKSTHNWPGFTIEARRDVPVKIKWINELYDNKKHYLKHLFSDEIDQTIHWANPEGLGEDGIDSSPCAHCLTKGTVCEGDHYCRKAATKKYEGPVPIVTHVHGAEGAFDFADGYSEAWYMPNAKKLRGPNGEKYSPVGTWYKPFKDESEDKFPADKWGPGYAVFNYKNSQRPAQLWYHDHVIGITRLNVYAGMAGIYNIRDKPLSQGPDLEGLPWPPPGLGPDHKVREIPLAIQDRIFDTAGQLLYPVNNIDRSQVLPHGEVPPRWIPEFIGTVHGQSLGMGGESAKVMVVNGKSWPKQRVVKEPYRLRLLNGNNARTLVVYFGTSVPTDPASPIPHKQRIPFYVIGNEAGFFASVVKKTAILMGPAERYDVIIDFSHVPAGEKFVYMLNEGPETPYDGMNNGEALTIHTIQIMRFDVAHKGASGKTVDRKYLERLNKALRAQAPDNLPAPSVTRKLTLLEKSDASSQSVVALYLGRIKGTTAVPKLWADPVTTNPKPSSVEEWQLINLSPDAHPIHIHEALFQVVDQRVISVDDMSYPPSFIETKEPLDTTKVNKEAVLSTRCAAGLRTGVTVECPVFKDTVLVPPGTVTTVRLRTASIPGLYQWHCHILEHEDNEMMWPWCVGQPGYTDPKTGKKKCPGHLGIVP